LTIKNTYDIIISEREINTKERKTKMKAYITFFEKNGTMKKVVWTLEEAKQNLTEKQFEKLTSWNGISTSKIKGYVA